MNSVCSISKLLKFILSDDNATVFYSNDDTDLLYDTKNNVLQELGNWFKCSKLSVNTSKTNLMLRGKAYKAKDFQNNKNVLYGCK